MIYDHRTRRIDQIPDAIALDGADEFAIWQAGRTRKITLQELIDKLPDVDQGGGDGGGGTGPGYTLPRATATTLGGVLATAPQDKKFVRGIDPATGNLLFGEPVTGTGGGAVYAGTVDITRAPYNADPTGVVDATLAFNNAFADPTVREVFGIGSFKITSPINIPSPKALVGVRRLSKFIIPSTFTGTGVVIFQALENGPMISNWDFEFDQPDVDYASLIRYPPAIYARDCPRFVLDTVRIVRAWDGIDMKGNSGGAILNFVEGSSFHRFCLIDGSLDTIKILQMHFWPFGALGGSGKLLDAYARPGNIGLEVGRCDDLKMTDCIFFACLKGVYLRGAEVTTPAVYGCFGNLTGCNFDASGGLYVELGDVNVSGCTFTTGPGVAPVPGQIGSGGPAIYVGAGSQVRLTGCKMFTTVVSDTTLGAIWNYGDLEISGMKFENDVDQVLVNCLANGSANLTMTGCHIKNRVSLAHTKTKVQFNQNPGSFVGNTVSGPGSGVLVSAIGTATVVIDSNQCTGFDIVANTKQIGYGNKNVANFKAHRRSGFATIPAGQTMVSVATNLFVTNDSATVPATVTVTPFNSDVANGQSSPRSYWVSDQSGNAFAIRINTSAAVALTFAWSAEADVT